MPHSQLPGETCCQRPPLYWMIFWHGGVSAVPTRIAVWAPLPVQSSTLRIAATSDSRVSFPPSARDCSTKRRVADHAKRP